MNWSPPSKPAELTESRLIGAILDGLFPINTNLPPERELAAQLGVTRPTLREALQRLARDGWLEIHHGRATRVRNYWEEGNLAVLAAIAQHGENPPSDFVPNLLAVRRLLAPAYTRLAIEHNPKAVAELLHQHTDLADTPQAFSAYDWRLHRSLTIASDNPVFTLILNGFQDLYLLMGRRYFALDMARTHSRRFYQTLLECAENQDIARAEAVTAEVMSESLAYWMAADT